MSTAQYLPPGGRGTAKRWMRNGETLPFAMQSIQIAQPFPMYLITELQTNSKHIAVPHPPQCAHWGTFPPGEGIVPPSSVQTPIYRAAEENRYAHHKFSKSSPKGIPYLISCISHLISPIVSLLSRILLGCDKFPLTYWGFRPIIEKIFWKKTGKYDFSGS